MSMGYKFCASVFAIAVIANIGFAEEPEPNLDCSIYRQGPLETQEIAIYRLPPNEDNSNYELVKVHYRKEYLFGGPSGYPDGRPNDSLLVDINIPDGQPLPQDVRYSAKPQEKTFFTMLLTGRPYAKPGRTIAILGGRSPLDMDFGQVINGVFIQDIGKFNRTGEIFYGFERVTIDDGWTNPDMLDQDSYAEWDQEGKVNAVMSCAKPELYPTPTCSINENSHNFELEYTFQRRFLQNLDKVRKTALDFANCLTEPLEEN